MYEGHSVGVVVPAYNERDSVGTVLEQVPAYVDRIFVVDDCSTDDTWDVVQALTGTTAGPAPGGTTPAGEGSTVPEADRATADAGDAAGTDTTATDGGVSVARGGVDAPSSPDGGANRSDDRIVPVRHDENRGAGGALKTGYHLAADAGMDLVVTIDADGQMDPAKMDRLLDPLVARKRAFAKGDRLASDANSAAMPRFRLVGNWLLTYLTRVASGYWDLRDPQNGYTAITGDALAAIDVDALPDHHDYCNALFAQLQVADVDVIDVPMTAIYGDEESTIQFSSFVPRTSKTLAASLGWRIQHQYLGGDGPSGATESADASDSRGERE